MHQKISEPYQEGISAENPALLSYLFAVKVDAQKPQTKGTTMAQKEAVTSIAEKARSYSDQGFN
jgi:hypothetical protein